MKKIVFVFAIFIHTSLAAQDDLFELTVQVEGIESADGKIRVGLYDNEENFLNRVLRGSTLAANGGSLVFTFKNLSKGTYAVSIYHDKNDNGDLDANFIGIPSEPYAFSNNAKGMFGPPSFDDCKFEVIDSNKLVTIKL